MDITLTHLKSGQRLTFRFVKAFIKIDNFNKKITIKTNSEIKLNFSNSATQTNLDNIEMIEFYIDTALTDDEINRIHEVETL